MAEHNEYGKVSEAKVAKFLAKKGYKILAKNYRYLEGEVDIIALETKRARKKKQVVMSREVLNEDVVVFVEVKARNNFEHIAPSEAVGAKKEKLYNKVAYEFLRAKKLQHLPYRFDIVEVFGSDVFNHIENGF